MSCKLVVALSMPSDFRLYSDEWKTMSPIQTLQDVRQSIVLLKIFGKTASKRMSLVAKSQKKLPEGVTILSVASEGHNTKELTDKRWHNTLNQKSTLPHLTINVTVQ
jgi:hypothetical protein